MNAVVRARVLEEGIVDDVPREWVARMKRAVGSLGPRFDADRMVRDHVLQSYLPAAAGVASEIRPARRR